MNIFADYHHMDAADSLYRLFEGRLGMKLYLPAGKQYLEKDYISITSDPVRDKKIGFGLFCALPFKAFDGSTLRSQSSMFRYTFRHVSWSMFRDMKFDVFLATLPHNIPRFKKLAAINNPKAKIVFRAGNNWPCLPRDPYMVNNLLLPSVGTYIEGMTPVFKKFPYRIRKALYGGRHWMEETPHGKFNICYAHSEFGDFFGPVYGKKQPKSLLSLMHCPPLEAVDYLHTLEALLPNWTLRIHGITSEGGIVKNIQDEADLMKAAGFLAHFKTHGDGYGFNLHRAAYTGCQLITHQSYYKGLTHPDDYTSACLLFGEDNFIDADKGMNYVLTELTKRSRDYKHYFDTSVKRIQKVMDFNREEEHVRKFMENLI